MSESMIDKVPPLHRRGIAGYENAVASLYKTWGEIQERVSPLSDKTYTDEEEQQMRLARVQVFHKARILYQRAKKDLLDHLSIHSDR